MPCTCQPLLSCAISLRAAKTFFRGKVVATLALGTRRLFDWAVSAPSAGSRAACGKDACWPVLKKLLNAAAARALLVPAASS